MKLQLNLWLIWKVCFPWRQVFELAKRASSFLVSTTSCQAGGKKSIKVDSLQPFGPIAHSYACKLLKVDRTPREEEEEQEEESKDPVGSS